MIEHTPLEREVAAIIADTLDEHTTLDTNRYTSVIWQIAEAVIKEVSTAERERIIKVLNTAKGADCGCDNCKGVHNYIDLLVDLIQGKNK